MEYNNINVDEKKLRKMLMQVILIEKKNSRTKQYSDGEMVNKIQKIIEEEIRCL